MRKAFAHILADLADVDSRLLLLTADLGYDVLDEFRARHHSRFINCGVREQAMVGAATGLAMEGFLPVCYSIATFAAFRPFEFIRNGPLHHNLPVLIVGAGRDEEYGHAGFTHWPLYDLDVLSDIGMECVEPQNVGELKRYLEDWAIDYPAPLYMGLSKNE